MTSMPLSQVTASPLEEGFTPFEVINGALDAGMVLLCDHARSTVPEPYGTLGLPPASFRRHIAYDIGAEAVTRCLAARLGVPAVHSCFSRLLIDPNRGVDDPTLIMGLSDGEVVPGNHPLSQQERENRIQRFHQPYHRAVRNLIDRCLEAGPPPILFSIHSFTPHWKGAPRPWHATMLWDRDPRMAHHVLESLSRHDDLVLGDNEPYDGCLKNDTLYQHATCRGLTQGLIEIRQDLICEDVGVERWVSLLAPVLETAMKRADFHERRCYGSRADGGTVLPPLTLNDSAMDDFTPFEGCDS